MFWINYQTFLEKYQKAINSIHKGYFDRSNFGGYRMLSKSTLGIIGFGRLGKIVQRIAKGFNMKVFTVDKTDQSYNLKLKKSSEKKTLFL